MLSAFFVVKEPPKLLAQAKMSSLSGKILAQTEKRPLRAKNARSNYKTHHDIDKTHPDNGKMHDDNENRQIDNEKNRPQTIIRTPTAINHTPIPIKRTPGP